MNETIKILAFGKITDITGAVSFLFPHCPNTDIFKEKLFQKYPELKTLSFALAVNKQMVTSKTEIQPNDEIVLLPPSSGG